MTKECLSRRKKILTTTTTQFPIVMAQDPNAQGAGNGNGDGDGNGDVNGEQEPKTHLEIAMDNLLQLGIPNLKPLDYTEDQMNAGTVGEMNDWAKANLDAAAYQEYRGLRRKDSKIEWLVFKIKAINEARASLLARLQAAPGAPQQQQQQQQQPGEQKVPDDDVDMDKNDDGNGKGTGVKAGGASTADEKIEKLEKTVLHMQQMFNQVLDKTYGNGSGNNDNGQGNKNNKGKPGNDR